METSYHMGARHDIFHPLGHPSFWYQMGDKRVKLKFRACRANAYIEKPGIVSNLKRGRGCKEGLESFPKLSHLSKKDKEHRRYGH
eukprot:scaffold83971_cov84-Attheya_sp.AAC.7